MGQAVIKLTSWQVQIIFQNSNHSIVSLNILFLILTLAVIAKEVREKTFFL